jgi:hypothetical protein
MGHHELTSHEWLPVGAEGLKEREESTVRDKMRNKSHQLRFFLHLWFYPDGMGGRDEVDVRVQVCALRLALRD